MEEQLAALSAGMTGITQIQQQMRNQLNENQSSPDFVPTEKDLQQEATWQQLSTVRL